MSFPSSYYVNVVNVLIVKQIKNVNGKTLKN